MSYWKGPYPKYPKPDFSRDQSGLVARRRN